MAPRQRTVIRGFAASVFIPPYCAPPVERRLRDLEMPQHREL
jgi:hypothetical protein